MRPRMTSTLLPCAAVERGANRWASKNATANAGRGRSFIPRWILRGGERLVWHSLHPGDVVIASAVEPSARHFRLRHAMSILLLALALFLSLLLIPLGFPGPWS